MLEAWNIFLLILVCFFIFLLWKFFKIILGSCLLGIEGIIDSFGYVNEKGGIIGFLLYSILWVIGFIPLGILFFILGAFEYKRKKKEKENN